MKRTAITMLRMLAICASLAVFTSACDEDDDDNLPIVDDDLEFNDIQLSGANERPDTVETDGSGTFDGEYDDASNELSFNVTWTLGDVNDSTVAMHFHGPADTTESAGIQIPITGHTNNYTGSVSGTVELTDQQEEDLEDGLWYINIHSTTYPNGELRGQLLED